MPILKSTCNHGNSRSEERTKHTEYDWEESYANELIVSSILLKNG